MQPASSVGQLPESLPEDAQVSLLTLLPGEPIYAAFAHSAIRFRDDQTGLDMVFNYGTFDPTAPYFVARFAYGEMDYYLSVYSMRLFMSSAVAENRSVIEQVLHMPKESRDRFYRRLATQARPENRVYRYDFLAENCSTILLDLLRETGGPALRFDSTSAVKTSYRQLLQPYLEERPFWDLGIDLVLGARVDRNVSYFERDFLPIELLQIIDGASISLVGEADTSEARRQVPFVSSTDTLLWVGEGYSGAKVFPWLAALAWIAVLALVTATYVRTTADETDAFRTDRWLFGILGFLGIFLTFMWFGTYHYVTQYNWNIVWALPTHMVVSVFWSRIRPVVRKNYFYANAGLMAVFFIAQPILPQHLHPAFLPLVVFIGWRSWRIGGAISVSA